MLRLFTKNKNVPGGWKLSEPLTSYLYKGSNYHQFESNVFSHRMATNKGSSRHGIILDLEDGWRERLEHEICLHLPEGLCFDPDNPQPYKTELEKRGRKLWMELHSHAQSLPDTLSHEDGKLLREWFRMWRLQIPNFGNCACVKHAEEILAAIPPDYSSGPAFYNWTVDFHNRVNQRLGKPIWPYLS